MRKYFVAALYLLLLVPSTPRVRGQAYNARPKLMVIVVIDQFRGDYLNRDRAEFKGRGFNLFMKKAPGSPTATSTTPTPRPRPATPPSAPARTPMATASRPTSGGT